MRKFKMLGLVLLVPFIGTGVALASPDKHEDKRPPGWSQGKKSGWDSDRPPGLNKHSDDSRGRDRHRGGQYEDEYEWEDSSGKRGDKAKKKYKQKTESITEDKRGSKERSRYESETDSQGNRVEEYREKSRSESRDKGNKEYKHKVKNKRDD